MKKVKVYLLLLIILGSPTFADVCSQISDANNLYNSVNDSTASNLSTQRLQQIVGVNADGIWGSRSETAYKNLISRCNSYSYAGNSLNIDSAKVTDYYKNQTLFNQIPYQSCTNEKIPILGKTKANPEVGTVVGGAVLGGIIGKTVTKKDKGAAVGAIIGGVIANETQKAKTKTEVIGYEDLQRCETKFKKSPREEIVYSHSTITFTLDGQEQIV